MFRQLVKFLCITQRIALCCVSAMLTGCSESAEVANFSVASDAAKVTEEIAQYDVTSDDAVTSDNTVASLQVEQSASRSLTESTVEVQSESADIEVTGTAAKAKEQTATAASSSTKSKLAPIYIEESNGKDLIAAAVKKAQRDHKHVLIEWGGNWCGWCFKLHDVFHNNATVRPIIHEEFELVLIDSQTNQDLMLEYGGKDRQYSFPHLTVLDESGAVLTNQETGSLEEGPKHDPGLVTEFLLKWIPEGIDAEKLLADSLTQAANDDKCVLVRVGSPYCGWCNVLAQFVQDHDALLTTDYVDIKIDTLRMTNGEQVAERLAAQKNGGVPWMVILDSSGKELASSFAADGNIGYPYQPNEIAHFITMIRETRKKLTDADLDKFAADLNAYREVREANTR